MADNLALTQSHAPKETRMTRVIHDAAVVMVDPEDRVIYA